MTSPEPLYREIKITKGQVVRVSPHRFDQLNSVKWCALFNPSMGKFYAYRNVWVGGGKYRSIYMHRVILGLDPGDKREADHKNLDTLDNTDENLRIATRRDNNCNRPVRKDNKVGLKGVSSNGSGWRSRITRNGYELHLGTFKTEEEAHVRYCEEAEKMHGKFARG